MNLKYMSVYEGLEHIEDLKALSSYRPGTRKGYIYVVEFRKDGGGLCKIGQTGCPFTRIHGMYYSDFIPTDILRFAISPAHKDPLNTEQYLHKSFESVRIPNTELFRMSFEQAVEFADLSSKEVAFCRSYNPMSIIHHIATFPPDKQGQVVRMVNAYLAGMKFQDHIQKNLL
jgi:hypothetical protein